MTIRTCVPADPQSKGGSEATVRIAKADLVPTEANLLDEYGTFAELEAACAGVLQRGERPAAPGDRPRRRWRCWPRKRPGCTCCRSSRSRSRSGRPAGSAGTPPSASTGCATRCPTSRSTTGCGSGGPATSWSSPSSTGRRAAGDRPAPARPARPPADPRRALPGRPSRPPNRARRADPAGHQRGRGRRSWPSATARQAWLVEAAAAGASRVRSKMAEAVAFAKLHGAAAVDQALGTAALAGRFADNDLAADPGPPTRRPGRHADPGQRDPQPAARHRQLGRLRRTTAGQLGGQP